MCFAHTTITNGSASERATGTNINIQIKLLEFKAAPAPPPPPTFNANGQKNDFFFFISPIYSCVLPAPVWASSLVQHVGHNEPKLHPFFQMKRNNRFLFHSILCAIWLVIACRHHRRRRRRRRIRHLIRFDVDDGCSGVARGHSIATVSCRRQIGRREKYSIIQLITITNNCTIFHLHSYSTPRYPTRHSQSKRTTIGEACSDISCFGFFDASTQFIRSEMPDCFWTNETVATSSQTLVVANANGSANCAAWAII